MSSLDVIVPCFNYGRFLPQCVASVLAQHIARLRILIIDDASTDQSLQYARALEASDQRVQVISHTQNTGHIATYNEGIDWVEAKYMLLLSADDFVSAGALERAISVLDRYEEISFVHGKFIEFVEENGQMRRAHCVNGRYSTGDEFTVVDRDLHQQDPDLKVINGIDFIRARCRVAGNHVGTATAVVRSHCQKCVGGYRPELPHSGDFEMWLRLAAIGSVGEIQVTQAFMRIHERNMRHEYFQENMFGDYKQRHATVQAFLSQTSEFLSDTDELLQHARRHLAGEAFWHASRLFAEGVLDPIDELLEFSRVMWPGIVRSGAWWRFQAKMRIGPESWRTISPLVSRFRRAWTRT